MSFPGQRIFFGDAGGLLDVSEQLTDYRTGNTAVAYEAGQYLYVGQEVPFNNLWLEVMSPNAASGTALSCDVWWNNAWHEVVDLRDGSASGTCSLAQPGRVSWSVRWDKSWSNEARASEVTGLEALEVYDLYWARFSFADDLAAGLRYVGQKFSGDAELFSQYPDLRSTQLMRTFNGGAGKTSWDEQHFVAAEAVVRELTARKIILRAGQIFDWTVFCEAAVHKTAEIIYSGMGAAYRENKKEAHAAYKAALNIDHFRVDKDMDGRLDTADKKADQTFLGR